MNSNELLFWCSGLLNGNGRQAFARRIELEGCCLVASITSNGSLEGLIDGWWRISRC